MPKIYYSDKMKLPAASSGVSRESFLFRRKRRGMGPELGPGVNNNLLDLYQNQFLKMFDATCFQTDQINSRSKF